MVGDPSGRSEERNLLDDDTLSANVAAIKAQMARILDFDDGRAVLVDNRDWTVGVTLLDFLRDVGKHVTVNQMLARESVKARLAGEHGISYTEFSYMLLQAHDYLHLHRDAAASSCRSAAPTSGATSCRASTWSAGSTGAAVARAVVAAAHGARRDQARARRPGARIWLDPARTSPYQFFQHWMQTDDRQVGEYLAKFTLLVRRRGRRGLTAEHLEHPERRAGQRRLAEEVTRAGARRGGGRGGRARDRRCCSAARRSTAPVERAGGRGGGGAHGAAPVDGELDGGRRPRRPAGGDRAGLLQGRRPPGHRPGRGQRQRDAGVRRATRWAPATCSTGATCCCGRASATTRCWSRDGQ